jgi:MFS family permease
MVFLLGYAMGLLLLVPLTDVFEIRRTILTTLIAGAGALILTSLASSALPFLSFCTCGGRCHERHPDADAGRGESGNGAAARATVAKPLPFSRQLA